MDGSAVVGVEDEDGLVKPLAYVKLNGGFSGDDDLTSALIGHCASNMAPYKRPRRIEYVDDLPKTATGKIQRFKLRG